MNVLIMVMALVGYLVVGVVIVAVIERRTDGQVEMEGSSVMVGLAVLLWPVVVFGIGLHLLGRLIRRMTK